MKRVAWVLILTAPAGAVVRADDWPVWGGNALGHRYAPEPGLNESLAPEWQFTLPAGNPGFVSSPVAAEGYVFIGARDGSIRCFRVDPETPKLPVWQYQTGDLVDATPAVHRGRCYVSSRDGRVYCFEAESGRLLWRTSIGGGNLSSPAIVPNAADPLDWSVVVGTGFPATSVVWLDGRTGGFETSMSGDGQPVFSSPAVLGGALYVGTNGGRLYALDAVSGTPVAAFNAGVTPGYVSTTGHVLLASPLLTRSAPGAPYDTVVFAPGGFDNHLYGWNAADGAERYASDLDLVLLKGRVPAFKPAPPPERWIWDAMAARQGRPRRAPSPSHAGRFQKPRTGAVLPRGVPGPYAVGTYSSSPALQPGLLAGVDVVYVVWGAKTGAPELSLVAASADTGAGLWRHPLGDGVDVPYVPSPAATGDLVFAVKPQLGALIALGAADESARGEWSLDGPVLASPCIANGRIFVATMAGTLYAFASDPGVAVVGNRPPPPPTTGWIPAGYADVTASAPTLSWSAVADPDGDPVSYLVRADDDGEVLMDWDFEAYVDNSGGGPPVTSAMLSPAVSPDTRVTWRVRSRDAKASGAASGAWSVWSAPQLFFVSRSASPPLPPGRLAALPRDARVDLTWMASSSNDVAGYRLRVAPVGQPFGAPRDVGNVTAHAVGLAEDGTALTNGTIYVFKLAAVDLDGQESVAVTAEATPVPAVLLNGAAAEDLVTAAAAAGPGDLIDLGAETFTLTETLTLAEGVRLAGHAPGFTVLDGGSLGTLIRIQDVGGGVPASIDNLTLRNGGTGVDTGGADVNICNVVFLRLLRGLDLGGGSRVEAVNDTFTQIVTAGVSVSDASASAVLRDNLFIRNPGLAVLNLGGAVTGGYNDFWYNRDTADGSDDSLAYPGFATDLAANVLFLDEANDDFRESASTAAVDAGDPADPWDREPLPNGGRVNLGAFGNTAYAASSGAAVPGIGALAVTPAEAYSPFGNEAGPFSPAGKTYTLTNTGATALAWRLSAGQAWLSLSASSGTLAAGASSAVTVSLIGAVAAALAPGAYTDTLIFVNESNGNGAVTQPATLTVVGRIAGPLAVTPSGGLSAAGDAGGPFSPSSLTYTLTNPASATGDLAWTAFVLQPWTSLSAASGTLAPGQGTDVTVTLDAFLAAALAPGAYADTVSFANTVNGSGSTTRPMGLTVRGASRLALSPMTALAASGLSGGPFIPSSRAYTLSNTGNAPLNWTAAAGQPWVSLAAASGTLAPAATAVVTVSIDATVAAGLAAGAYSDTVAFTNTTDGSGNTLVALLLTVTTDAPPALAVTSPATPSSTTAQSQITVAGSASDNLSVAQVAWSNASTGGSGAASGTATWSAVVDLQLGSNIISVTAFDNAGNGSTVTITVTRQSPAPAPADTDGDGMADAAETAAGFDPANSDQDGDGVADGQDDWDGDGINNQAELAAGSLAGAPPAVAGGRRGGGGGGRGCAITTAAYAALAPDSLLRFYRFRDESLRTNRLGHDLVGLYYRLSPPVAGAVSDSEVLRMAVRRLLGPGR